MLAALISVCVLLIIGVVLRERLRFLAFARIPASLIAGAVGLLVVQWVEHSETLSTFVGTGQELANEVPSLWDQTMSSLRQWPGVLIAVVFAGMLLARRDSTGAARTALRGAAREGLMVWIIVLGQTAVGLWVTWWFIQPWFDVPNSTAMLIETGFAGGHGTAAAMGSVYEHPIVGFPEGFPLGVLMATAGLVYGLVSGVVWINVAIAREWIVPPHPDPPIQSEESTQSEQHDKESEAESLGNSVMGRARIGGESLDPLLLQVIWLTLAFGIGLGLQQAVAGVAEWLSASGPSVADSTVDLSKEDMLREKLTMASVIGSFPLFIYTLFGGAIVRWALRMAGQVQRIDVETIHRLVGTSMDLLVVAAVATLNLSVVASMWVPFSLLFGAGAVWSTLCLLVLSRLILRPEIWFQLGLINYGMSTGTTATGFVLLRVVDPDLECGAAEDYALAAPLSSPFVGGGMLTVALPLLVLERISIGVSAIVLTGIVGTLIGMGIWWNRKQFPHMKNRTR